MEAGRRVAAKGFTLIELIVGILLVVVVLSATLLLLSTMTQYALKGAKQGRATGDTALNIETMLTDFRNATYIDSSQTQYPASVSGCDNYAGADSVYGPATVLSNAGVNQPGPISPEGPSPAEQSPIVCFHYWVDSQHNLWGTRYSAVPSNGGHCPCNGGDPTQILAAGNFFEAPAAQPATACLPQGGGLPFFAVATPVSPSANSNIPEIKVNFCVGTPPGNEGPIPVDMMVTTSFPLNIGGG